MTSEEAMLSQLLEDDDIEMGAARLTNDAIGLIHQALSTSEMSRKQLADKLNVGESRISQVLSGEGNIRISTLGRYLAALGFRADVSLSPINEPKRRSRRDASVEQAKASFSVWSHQVTTVDGCHQAYVFAADVDKPGDALHHTTGLLFHSGSPLNRTIVEPKEVELTTDFVYAEPKAHYSALIGARTNGYS